MALSNLKSYTYEQYRALNITSFALPPTKTPTGDPNPNASVSLAGWVGDNLIAFTVSNGVNILTSVTLDERNNWVAVTVTSFSPANANTTYWTIDLGTGAKSTDWSVTYDVAGGNKTGTWTFVKGKMTNDDDFIPKP